MCLGRGRGLKRLNPQNIWRWCELADSGWSGISWGKSGDLPIVIEDEEVIIHAMMELDAITSEGAAAGASRELELVTSKGDDIVAGDNPLIFETKKAVGVQR